MNNIEEKACLCALNRIFGFEPKIALALISHLGSASDVFRLKPHETDLLLGPHSKYRGMISRQAIENSAKELEELSNQGICFTGWSEDGYPSLLKECEDAPLGLYLKSKTPPCELWKPRRRISIVGTRDLSPYGREWCERLVCALSKAPEDNKPVIVSGLAIGTDINAHLTALKTGLPTIAVMATGPEETYPRRHREYASLIAGSPDSGLITDYPPGTSPLAIHFLRRNRIIAGLSDATILIESKIKGGGMMTARLAASYNRDVFALPGRVDDLRSQGCNYLIRNGTATPLISIEDCLKELGISFSVSKSTGNDNDRLARIYGKSISKDRIERMSNILIIIRKRRGITIEEITQSLDIDYSEVLTLTGLLETDGIITTDLLQRCFISFSSDT